MGYAAAGGEMKIVAIQSRQLAPTRRESDRENINCIRRQKTRIIGPKEATIL